MLFLSAVISGHIGPAIFAEAVIYIILGILILFLGDFSVVKAIILAVIYSLVLQIIAVFAGYDFPRAIFNFIINVALNCFLFIRLGDFLAEIL